MMPRSAMGSWQLGGGEGLHSKNDEATFKGGGVGSRTSSKWMRRLLLGKMKASGHSPSEPQFVAGMRKRRRSGGRGNAITNRNNEMTRGQHDERQLNNQPAR
jgi:hypothetical protein